MYFNGTVSVKKGSKQLIGVGTKFKYAMANISAGQLITIDSNGVREINIIQSIQSNEELTLFWESKVDISNSTYVISTTISGSLPDFGQKNSATVQWANKLIDGISQLMTSQSDTIKIEMPYGEIVELKTYKSKISIGDFGVGASALNSDKVGSPTINDAHSINRSGFFAGNGTGAENFLDNYMPIISATRSGGKDGTGTVLLIQASTDFNSADIGFKRRSGGLWNDWQMIATKTTDHTQRFNGQLMSYNGVFSSDKNNQTNYFGFLRAERGNPYGFYLSYDNSGYSVKFPERKAGTIVIADPQYITHKSVNDWSGIRLYKANGEYGYIETNTRNNEMFTLGYRNSSDVNQAVLAVPRKSGTLLVSGDYGIGQTALNTNGRLSDLLSTPTGFWSYINPANMPSGVVTYGSCISTKYASDNFQNILLPNYGSDYVAIQRITNGEVSTVQLLSSNKFTVDSNGFYKKSSPIIKIKTNGDFIVNDESEGAVVDRVGVGHYRVLNVEGFHSDLAWGVDGGISVPKDHNDNPLIWIEPEVNADGSIDIYTFHRENYIPDSIRKMRERRLNKMGGIYSSKVDGEPCDIPEGAFVDVRVEMPYNSIYNIKKRAMERVFALKNIIRVQEEIINSKIKLLTKK